MDIQIGALHSWVVLVLLGSLLLLAYWFLTRHFNYWNDRNVAYIEPTLLFGSLQEVILKRTSWKSLFDKWYTEFKNVGVGGAYFLRTPVAFVCDVELIEKILVEDFDYFRDRVPEYDTKIAMATSLSHSSGDRWRELHLKIAPTFSSVKIKGMIGQIFDCTGDIMIQISSNIDKNEPLQVENMSFLYTSEVISRCSFGVSLFTDTAECRAFQSILDLVYDTSFSRLLFNLMVTFNPRIVNLLNIDLLPNKVSKLLFQLTKNIIQQREEDKIRRNDYLQILLDLKEQEVNDISLKKENLFTDQSISVLMFNFLLVGLKSTSTTLSFALFEIARNRSIQERLHKEIDTRLAKHGGWTFECIQKMTYLSRVIQETLRLHCANLGLYRIVKKNYEIPRTGFVLEEGLLVVIPIHAIHMDPQYYPNPEVFNPDRFEDSNCNPTFSFLPFGSGPRMCIAMKFAQLLMKCYVARILSENVIKISNKMVLPLEYEKCEYYPKAKGGIWLEFSKRTHRL